MSRKKKRRKPILLYLIIIVVVAAVELLVLYMIDRPYKKVVINAGQPMIEASTFFKSGGNVVYKKNTVDTKQPGEYKIKVKKGIFTYTSKVVVKDETAPVVDYYREMSIAAGESLTPEALIKSIAEDSYYTVSFLHAVDTVAGGYTTAEVLVRDAAGNETRFSTSLHVVDANIISYLSLEAGTVPTEKDFFKDGNAAGEKCIFTPDLGSIDFTTIGEKKLTLKYKNDNCSITVMVVDTVAPVATVVERKVKKDSSIKAEDFVKNIIDQTPVTVEYVNVPNFSVPGSVTVSLVLKDEAGNTTFYTTTADVIDDKVGPVITGELERDIYIGEDASLLSGITGTDECDGTVVVYVDKDKVKLDTPGDYEVTYYAFDEAGNRTEVKGMVHVHAARSEEAKYDRAVAEVLATVVTDSMTLKAKAKAIYSWVWSHCKYKGTAKVDTYDDWRKEALLGLQDIIDHKSDPKFRTLGDCYTAFSLSKALLQAIGVETYDVTRLQPNRQNSRHFWLLVNLGEGWYQFDAQSRVTNFGSGDSGGFLFTKAQAAEYNKLKPDYFLFDESLYPDIDIK